MATNTNKRVAIKWIRDGAKSAYRKQSSCYICETTENLELHHTHGLTNLFEKWASEKGYPISTDDEVLAIRDEFIDTHHQELYVDVYTLCNLHHQKLHKVYGKSPPLHTAKKQSNWVEAQRAKAQGIVPEAVQKESPKKSWFSQFTKAN